MEGRLASDDLAEVRHALEELAELEDVAAIACHADAAVAHLGPDRDVCLAALDVLDRLAPSAVALRAEAMLARLETTEPGLRYRVVEVLATMEPAAPLALVAVHRVRTTPHYTAWETPTRALHPLVHCRCSPPWSPRRSHSSQGPCTHGWHIGTRACGAGRWSCWASWSPPNPNPNPYPNPNPNPNLKP